MVVNMPSTQYTRLDSIDCCVQWCSLTGSMQVCKWTFREQLRVLPWTACNKSPDWDISAHESKLKRQANFDVSFRSNRLITQNLHIALWSTYCLYFFWLRSTVEEWGVNAKPQFCVVSCWQHLYCIVGRIICLLFSTRATATTIHRDRPFGGDGCTLHNITTTPL